MNNFFILIITIILFFFTDFILSKTSLPINNKSYLMGYKFFTKLRKPLEKKRIILLGGSSLGMGVSAEEIFMKTKTLTLNSVCMVV